MNPHIQQASPILEGLGIPPPYGGGNRKAALLADSFSAASFQSFLDQAGIISKPMEPSKEDKSAPEPRSAKPLAEGRPLVSAQPMGLLPPDPVGDIPMNEVNPLLDAGAQGSSAPATMPVVQQATDSVKDPADIRGEESPFILWNDSVALNPRVAMQGMKTPDTMAANATGKGMGPQNLEQMLAQMRGQQVNPLRNGFAAESLVQSPPMDEAAMDPSALGMTPQTIEAPVDESMLRSMLQDPSLTQAQRAILTPPPAHPQGFQPNGLVAGIQGSQLSNGFNSDPGGNQQGLGQFGQPGQTNGVGGKGAPAAHSSRPLSAHSPHFADELANRVGRMRLISRPGQTDQVKITLDPKDLGELSMRLHLDDENRVHLMISAESETAKEMLNRQMSQLKESLAKQNIGFGEVMVEVNTQEKNQQGGAFGQHQGDEGGFADYREQEELDADLLPGERVIFRSDGSGLNVIA